MQVSCPSCGAAVELHEPPVRGPGGGGNEAWLCLKCPATLCVWCYVGHLEAVHPEVYHGHPRRPTAAHGKNRRHRK